MDGLVRSAQAMLLSLLPPLSYASSGPVPAIDAFEDVGESGIPSTTLRETVLAAGSARSLGFYRARVNRMTSLSSAAI
jgi:hypothetical protein